VFEMNGAAVEAVLAALRQAGFGPSVGDAPGRWSGSAPRRAAWVRVPGPDAYVIVAVADVLPDDGPHAWRAAHGATAPAVVGGYRVSFHERPFRTRGHPYADAAEDFYTVFVDDVVAKVDEWSRWQTNWSVTPTAEPSARRLTRLRRVAASRLGSAAIPVEVELDPLMLALLDRTQAAATHQAVAELFLAGIRWRFPRDKHGGKLATRAQVLLYECAPPAHPAGKGIWLAVDGPPPRAEQRLTIGLTRAVARSARHRWDRMPEYWRTGHRTLDELWGVDGTVSAAFVDEVTDALLDGRTLEALVRCDVAVDRSTERLLTGLPDRFQFRQWTDKWVTNATDLVVGAAPWRWRNAVVAGQRPHRLETLGGFNPNRRPGLFLAHADGKPRLSFDQSASPLVVPRVCWQRDVDYDLVRLGLLTREQIPLSGP
jgi:hypothetical protein